MKRIIILFITIILVFSMSTVVGAKKVATDDGRLMSYDLYKYFTILGYPTQGISTFQGKYPEAEDYDVYQGEVYQIEAKDIEYVSAKNIFDYYANEGENIKPLQTPYIYYAIHDLEIKREDFVTVYTRYTEEELDLLYSDDVAAVRKHFKSPSVFFCEEDGNVYNLLDLMLCDEETLIGMDVNGELTEYLEYMLSDNETGFLYDSHDISMMEFWYGDHGWTGYYEAFGLFLVDTLELLNPDKDYSIPEPYEKWVAPQTGFATYAYAAVAVVAAAGAVALAKRRRKAV